MKKIVMLDGNGFTPMFAKTFGKLTCITRSKDVAVRMEQAEVLSLKYNIPMKTLLHWAQKGNGSLLHPFISNHITYNVESVLDRCSYYDMLIEAGYSEESIVLWSVFGDKALLKKAV